jgi:hypothetical protein
MQLYGYDKILNRVSDAYLGCLTGVGTALFKKGTYWLNRISDINQSEPRPVSSIGRA